MILIARNNYTKNTDILKSRSKPLSKLVNDALGVNQKRNISDSLISLLNEIREKDTLQLTSTDRIAAFFGIVFRRRTIRTRMVRWYCSGIIE